MPLVPMSRLLSHAQRHRYAVGYFEAWNMESILAVKDAAEEADSPVILGFNGGFLSNPKRRIEENVFHYGSLGRAVADQAKVPVALILNEADQVPLLIKGLHAGFNVIMHDHQTCSHEEALAINQYLARTAHAMDAEVEAEIGELPVLDLKTESLSPGRKTDPQLAASFVEQTGIDALAVAVGNVHMLEGRKASLDLQLIHELRRRVKVPLVLHGGTGIESASLKEAIQAGISKINVGTLLRRAFMNALRKYFEEHELKSLDPGEATSTGGRQDMLTAARQAVAAEVRKLMELFGSAGMASRFDSEAVKDRK
jgi:ketose-bisphosphate aldolase